MRKSLFKKLMAVLFGLFVILFAWMIYVQPKDWWKVALFFLVFTPIYFVSVRTRCESGDRHGAFAPELGSEGEAKKRGNA